MYKSSNYDKNMFHRETHLTILECDPQDETVYIYNKSYYL